MLDASVTSVNISFLKEVAGWRSDDGDGNAAGTPSLIQSVVRLDGHVVGFIEATLDTIGRFFKCVNNSDVSCVYPLCEKRFDLSSHRLDSLEMRCVVRPFFLAVCFSSI